MREDNISKRGGSPTVSVKLAVATLMNGATSTNRIASLKQAVRRGSAVAFAAWT